MKVASGIVLLLSAGLSLAASAATVLHNHIVQADGDNTIIPQENRNGWVNPEDLNPMPQCIAQQDQTKWFDAMTKCTQKRCTSHFWFICTHSQWLTELSCLGAEFSTDLIREYLPYCGRSILAKAQLYFWTRRITGRTWLVDVDDASGLDNLSPDVLARGYTSLNTIHRAPICLTSSHSNTPSMEPFQHVIDSCVFTRVTEVIGNDARMWEYNEPRKSMTALGFETAGFDLMAYVPNDYAIIYGYSFDNECFCSFFKMNPEEEPCSDPRHIDFTVERTWMKAVCGPSSVPDKWSDLIRLTGPVYIPAPQWRWPNCLADMSTQVTERIDECAIDACELDSDGFCDVKSTIDSSCFCRGLSYDSSEGSCHFYETRIDYVNWLHGLCGNFRDWNGLPDNWPELAAPMRQDMIPWQWTIKPVGQPMGQCTSKIWKLRSLILVNMAAPVSALVGWKTGLYQTARGFISRPRSSCWIFKGIFIAALQLFANWLNAYVVLSTPGYEHVPKSDLILLWCSIPRPGWLPLLQIGLQPFKEISVSAVMSALLGETITQVFSAYYMLMTINYGLEHEFYNGRLESTRMEGAAQSMYAGAMLWLIASFVLFAQLMSAALEINRMIKFGKALKPLLEERSQEPSNIVEELTVQLGESFAWLNLAAEGMLTEEETPTFKNAASTTTYDTGRRKKMPPVQAPNGVCPGSSGSQVKFFTVHSSSGKTTNLQGGPPYGTMPAQKRNHQGSYSVFLSLYAPTAIGMLLLYAAQWLFWSGFIDLSSEDFCPPSLEILTIVWLSVSIITGLMSG